MIKSLIGIFLDLIHTAGYILLLHVGYNINDQVIEGKKNVLGYIFIWLLAAVIIFLITKDRYDREVEEGNKDEFE